MNINSRESKLVSEIKDLEDILKEAKATNRKLRHVRNLKIFKSVCTMTTPFVLGTTLISGAFFLSGYGLPFVMDDSRMVKKYELEYSIDGQIKENEEYVRWSENDADASIKVYAPYYLDEDGKYRRVVKYCENDDFDDKEMFEAILANDLTYVYSNLDNCDIITEDSFYTSLDENYDNDYKLSADIVYYDKDDSLWVRERRSNNIGITTLDIFFGLVIGGIGFVFTKDRFLDIKYARHDYRYRKIPTREMRRKLKNKLLCLRKEGGKRADR